ncbi:uncharacterized protein [Gorilla gorilla gorilla]|uniref:uncharacterized protein isoform X1 n=1 Tax=Gorilla gorilla gorilla TaxID=9595 RepID=UPI003008C009
MLRAPAGERSGCGGGAAGAPDGAGGGETRHPPAQSCPTRLGRTPPPGCLGTIPGIQGKAVRAGTGGYVRHRLFPITIATEDWSRCGSRSVLLQMVGYQESCSGNLTTQWKKHWSSWLSLQTPGGTPLGSSSSHPFGLRLNYTTNFPGSPPCRWQIVELLGLHSCMKQFSY